MSYFNLTNWAW